jgi:sarcosine oxidase/L-pipecolate oxidase
MGVSKSDPIIIVGGGAFGLSTALHLTRDGFTNVAIYEKDDHIPPRFSAANDLNKIVRAEYEDPFYTDLTIVRYIHTCILYSPKTYINQCLRDLL